MRKRAIKVYVSKEQELFMSIVEKKLGLSMSQIFVIAFMDYIKELGLLKEEFAPYRKT